MEEIWKDVVGYEKYYKVNNDGVVLSKDRWRIFKGVETRNVLKGRIVSRCFSNNYNYVSLNNNKPPAFVVHQST